MANPSLQIGNSNWAIKKDNLLGYSTAGTRFLPIPITMTRASAGTRVNPQGLVETVELLGSELVPDSDFILTGTQAEETTGTYWTTGTDWSISGGAATLNTASGSSSLSSNTMSVTVGKLYRITINVSATSSGFRLYDSLGVVSYGLPLGESVFYRTPSSSIYTVTPLGLAGASGIVTSVSVKEYQANDLARVDYTGSTSSLLAEPQRTNLVTYSEDFSQWSTNATITLNSAISPDGTQNASLFSHSGGSFPQVALTGITFVSGADYSPSLYVKSDGTSQVQHSLLINNVVVNFTPTDEWVRVSDLIVSPDTSGSFVIAQNSGTSVAASFYIWGAQLESGSFPTSYIPTSGSTVTRVQDQYSKTGISDKIGQTEGVIFVEMAYPITTSGSGNKRIAISDNTSSNRVMFAEVGNTGISALITYGGVNSAYLVGNVNNLLNFKVAIKYKENDFALWVNGVEVATDTSGSTPIGLSRLAFDGGDGGNIFYGKVKQLQVFKTALTDSELATLTTI